ncbi:MAG: hypothetical protein UH071_01990 [Paludibacteraceae bacterium]|nr:hypothetical protein [Paludibacteraceae bacterium]
MKDIYIPLKKEYISNLDLYIKDKWEYIKLLLDLTRYALFVDANTRSPNALPYLYLFFQKKKNAYRIFLFTENDEKKEKKYISFNFPFRLTYNNNKKKIESFTFNFNSKEFPITYKEISNLLEIINSKNDSSFVDVALYAEDLKSTEIEILDGLLQLEPGYIRYDEDKKHENGNIHPRYHLDVNFSHTATFKQGIPKELATKDFEDIFEDDTDCWFLKKL